MPRLAAPLITYVLGDDTERTVQPVNADLLRWDRTRNAKKWPGPDDAPFLWLTFLAWAALKRQGDIDMSLEDFEGQCLSVAAYGDETIADPTRPGAVPG